MAFQKLKQLITDAHVMAAMLNNKTVLVIYHSGEIADYGGHIEEASEITIKINGAFYTKAACRFYIIQHSVTLRTLGSGGNF